MSDLRTRIASAIYEASDEYTRKLMVNPRLPGCESVEGDSKPVCFVLADAVIRELTDAIPPIVASAIHAYADSELAAITHHGEAGEYDMLKRLNREALQIARYATTHKDWNG